VYIGLPQPSLVDDSVVLDPIVRHDCFKFIPNIISYPLLGIKTPFPNRRFEHAYIAKKYRTLDPLLLRNIIFEAQRIAECVHEIV
jgi:hypothetical protein